MKIAYKIAASIAVAALILGGCEDSLSSTSPDYQGDLAKKYDGQRTDMATGATGYSGNAGLSIIPNSNFTFSNTDTYVDVRITLGNYVDGENAVKALKIRNLSDAADNNTPYLHGNAIPVNKYKVEGTTLTLQLTTSNITSSRIEFEFDGSVITAHNGKTKFDINRDGTPGEQGKDNIYLYANPTRNGGATALTPVITGVTRSMSTTISFTFNPAFPDPFSTGKTEYSGTVSYNNYNVNQDNSDYSSEIKNSVWLEKWDGSAWGGRQYPTMGTVANGVYNVSWSGLSVGTVYRIVEYYKNIASKKIINGYIRNVNAYSGHNESILPDNYYGKIQRSSGGFLGNPPLVNGVAYITYTPGGGIVGIPTADDITAFEKVLGTAKLAISKVDNNNGNTYYYPIPESDYTLTLEPSTLTNTANGQASTTKNQIKIELRNKSFNSTIYLMLGPDATMRASNGNEYIFGNRFTNNNYQPGPLQYYSRYVTIQ